MTGRRPGPARAPTVRERAAGREGEGTGRQGRLGAGPGVTSPARLDQSGARFGLLKAQGNLSVSGRTKKGGAGVGRGHASRPRPSPPPSLRGAAGLGNRAVPLSSVLA